MMSEYGPVPSGSPQAGKTHSLLALCSKHACALAYLHANLSLLHASTLICKCHTHTHTHTHFLASTRIKRTASYLGCLDGEVTPTRLLSSAQSTEGVEGHCAYALMPVLPEIEKMTKDQYSVYLVRCSA
eukprot:1161512-Pelagomonas_calceolata.AAC.9